MMLHYYPRPRQASPESNRLSINPFILFLHGSNNLKHFGTEHIPRILLCQAVSSGNYPSRIMFATEEGLH